MFWLLALAALIVAYVFARPYLLAWSPAWRAFCAWVDPIFVFLFTKSRQIAIARLSALSGVLIAFSGTLSGIPIDWSMIGDWLVSFFPATWQPVISKMILPFAIWAYGECMRRVTTQPVAAKE